MLLRSSFLGLFLIVGVGSVGHSGQRTDSTDGIKSDSSTRGANAIAKGLLPDDWSSIRQAYERGRFAAQSTDRGYRMRNPGQRWETVFDDCGFTTRPDKGDWTWGLELESYGFPGHERAVSKSADLSAQGGRIVRVWDQALDEWYVNDSRGLEHGYTLSRRPEGRSTSPDEQLVFELRIRGGLSPEITASGLGVRFLDESGLAVLTYSGLAVFDADGVSLFARFELESGRLSIRFAERGARYPLTIDPVAQQAYLKASNTDDGDSFGESISISGDTVVVGAPGEKSLQTGVNGNDSDNSASGNAGAAYVFVRSGMSWSQEAYLKASNTDGGDFFGGTVSVSGDTIVVGALCESSNATGVNGDEGDDSSSCAGAAYVYVRSGTTWSQEAYLKASNTELMDIFGVSVSVSGDTIVVGADEEDSTATGVNGDESDNLATDSGAAYVFVRSGTTWSQEAYLKASNTEGADNFGQSVSVSGDIIVVGASSEDGSSTVVNGDGSDNLAHQAGAAYVFVRSGTTWSQEAYLKPFNTDSEDRFGFSVSASGDRVLVGALVEASGATEVNGDGADNSLAGAGAAYVFVRSGTSWSQEAYLKASNPGLEDRFARAVSLSGDIAVVGAWAEDSAATGVDGDQEDNGAPSSGSAYVFARSVLGWRSVAYLKASNTEAGDFFGLGVSVSGTTVVVGAQGEDSSATGVDGNGADTGARGSGAAYAYRLPDCDEDGIPDATENDLNGDAILDECQPIEFCFGVQCTCGNDDPAAGCRNSSGQGGRLIVPPSFVPGSGPLTVIVENCPPHNLALVLVADALQPTMIMGDGRMCLAGPSSFAHRYTPVITGELGEIELTDATAQPPSRSFQVGQTYYFQAWYRDVFCTPLPVPCISPCGTASNFTNVTGVVVIP